jgi:hypothetical protein
MKRAHWFAIAVTGIVAFGCDGDSLRTLSQADVVGIPPGDATGSLFSGQYASTGIWKGACRCRVGSCSEIAVPGEPVTFPIVQTDGRLEFVDEADPANSLLCSIDSDGSFVCGSDQSSAVGVSYVLTTGRITLANGSPASMNAISENTVVFSGYDCDFQVGFQASYVGP